MELKELDKKLEQKEVNHKWLLTFSLAGTLIPFQKLQTFSWLRLYYLYENADLEIGGKFLPKFSHKCD